MSVRTRPPAPLLPFSIQLDAETARHHHRIRVALIQLLTNATPTGWVVTDTSNCIDGTTLVPLDIAVRNDVERDRFNVPVLCIDISACSRTVDDRDHTLRRQSLARVGVDHYWNLNTATKTLNVYIRHDNEYRHAETMTETDWLDYSIGIVDINLPQLLKA